MQDKTPAKHKNPAPLLPMRNLAGASLAAVAGVMSFLGCLAIGAVYLANSASETWVRAAATSASVQIIDTENLSAKDQLGAVLRVLDNHPAIADAREFSYAERIALLDPWLSPSLLSEELPIPLLIAITPAPDKIFNADELAAELKAVAPGAVLDTHARWRSQLTQIATTIKTFGGLILLTVFAATTMLILFATRAGLIANRDILAVLHQCGAYDGFIAKLVQKHFAQLVGVAAAAGFIAAIILFAALGAPFTLPLVALLLAPPLISLVLAWGLSLIYVLRNLAVYNI